MSQLISKILISGTGRCGTTLIKITEETGVT
jgi:hypothetical protein